ncbi:transcription initiation factor TFIID subunit 3 [Morus notabilis]|uniref:transcription initiation factor TFIID subunit 3 n=1 Tax=Morus notabilis TaxID=981085 RepID=UPI000CED36E1|nr:transcription initiation factor TFIID subunit 3 [Morus notabilis]
MDLETENRIAAILMKEAAELRRQAEKEGVHVYLQQPKARVRPNKQFLTATVLGVQQSNRAVETNEMWRIRQKELELDDRLKHKSKDQKSNGQSYRDCNSLDRTSKRHVVADDNADASCSCGKGFYDDFHSRKDDGLKDEELEEFLHSRTKRGRGAVGSRMDETGPYLPRFSDSKEESRSSDVIERHVVYGPQKPSSLKLNESSEEENDERRKKKRKKDRSRCSKKQHSEKHRSKGKSDDKGKRKKDEKRSKHNH